MNNSKTIEVSTTNNKLLKVKHMINPQAFRLDTSPRPASHSRPGSACGRKSFGGQEVRRQGFQHVPGQPLQLSIADPQPKRKELISIYIKHIVKHILIYTPMHLASLSITHLIIQLNIAFWIWTVWKMDEHGWTWVVETKIHPPYFGRNMKAQLHDRMGHVAGV